MSKQQVTKKNLFDDDSEDEVAASAAQKKGSTAGKKNDKKKEDGLGRNQAYAEKFEVVKRKQELQALTNKYGNDLSDSDASSEDDDARDITTAKEEAFAEVLYKLRTNDPSVHDKNKRFFDDLDESSSSDDDDTAAVAKSKKPFTLKDAYTRGVEEGDDEAHVEVDEDEVKAAVRKGPKTEKEKQLKAKFLAAVEESGDADADQVVTKKEVQQKLTAKDQRKKKMKKQLAEALTAGTSNTDDDKFLADFFVNEKWRGGDEDEDANFTMEQVDADEADEEFFDEAEQWEQEWQQQKYRHEEGEEANAVATFPRQQEGLLRAKDSSRKDARARKKERQVEAAERATEELKRLKHLKMQEINDQRKMISTISGMENEERLKAMISKADLEEDYDPAKFDAMMAKLFSDDYYNDEDEDLHSEGSEAAEEELLEYIAPEVDLPEGDEPPEEFIVPTGAEGAADNADDSPEEEGDLGAGEAAPGGADDLDFLYPTQAIEKSMKAKKGKKGAAPITEPIVGPDGRTRAEVEKDLDKKMDEYWRLHYNSVAGGGRTRFEYIEVPKENFGITDEEILALDDRTLNMRAPLNCYATYLTEAENKADRYKAIHRAKTLRMLPSERKSRRYKGDTVALDANDEDGEAIAAKTAEIAQKVQRDLEQVPGGFSRAQGRDSKRGRDDSAPPRGRGRGRGSDRSGRGGGFARGGGFSRGRGGQDGAFRGRGTGGRGGNFGGRGAPRGGRGRGQ